MSAQTSSLEHKKEGLAVRVIALDNILDKRTRRTSLERWGRPIADYAPAELRGRSDLRVARNGLMLHGDELLQEAKPGDELIIYPAPLGDPITIGIIVSIVVSVLVAGVSIGISLLLAPSISSPERGKEDSPTYGFDGIFNTVRPGTRIPIIYGKHRHGGHILQQFQRPARDTDITSVDPKAGELHTLLGQCTGPIAGIEDVRIDKNPISDFKGVRYETRLGGNHQSHISGFDDVVIQSPKNAEIKQATGPLTFTTTAAVDAFEVIFRFPSGLVRVSDSGGFRQNTCRFLIEYREQGTTPWIIAGEKVVTARTTSALDAFFDSQRLPRAVYEIRVTRTSPDESRAVAQSGSTVLAVSDVIEKIFTYPRMALLGVKQLPTNQVNGRAPQYDCLVTGKIVRIFTDEDTYTEAWSDNPAWCLLDLLTDNFDGLGAWIDDSRIDIPAFIAWAAFCDTMVAKDKGGDLEKRFRLNIVLDGSLLAIDAIKQICTIGRGNFFLRGDKWTVRAEEPSPPVQLFSMGRIKMRSFGVAKKPRDELTNYFTADFANEDLDYEPDILPKEDETLTEGQDQKEGRVNLVGATNISQVRRSLNYFVLANRLQRRLIEFETGLEALAMEAGDVFKVSHDVPGWGFSGKFRDVLENGQTLILDREVTIEAFTDYEVTVIHPDDTIDVVTVTSGVGTSERVQVTGDWSQTPAAGADYAFGPVGQSTVLYRCTSITEGETETKVSIRAEEYDERVYGEDLTVLELPSVSQLPDPFRIPADVRDLRLTERTVYAEDGTLSAAVDVHFTLPTIAGARAKVFWREVGDLLWEESGVATTGYWTLEQDIQTPGFSYEVSVVSMSPVGNHKHPDNGVQATITTIGSTRRPDQVVNFRADRISTGLYFSWDPLDPDKNFDLAYYEIRTGMEWDSALLVGRTQSTTFESAIIAKGEQTYLIKGFNTAGRDSAIASAIVLEVEGRIGENVIYERIEEPDWTGLRQNLTESDGKLTLDTEATIVAWRARLEVDPASGGGLIPGGRGVGFLVTGAYETEKFQVVTTNAVRAFVSTILEVSQVDLSAFWTAPGVGDQSWTSDYGRTRTWAVAPNGLVRAKVEMRFSTTDSNDASFGPWQERAQSIEVALKWAQARVLIEVRDPSFTARIEKLHILVDPPDITEGLRFTTSAVGTVAVAYVKEYNNEPKLAAQVIGATAGDEIFITGKNSLGFDCEVKNAGNRVVRTVEATVIGY